MMEALRQYFISVTAAAMICAIASAMVNKKDSAGELVRIISGMILAFTVIAPIARVRIDDFLSFSASFETDAQAVISQGENMAAEAMERSIKERTEAYILDKANALGVQITAEVTLSRGELPVPTEVILRGDISPYAKQALQEILSQDLGIAKEDQLWIR